LISDYCFTGIALESRLSAQQPDRRPTHIIDDFCTRFMDAANFNELSEEEKTHFLQISRAAFSHPSTPRRNFKKKLVDQAALR
jgi:hypothetical protein